MTQAWKKLAAGYLRTARHDLRSTIPTGQARPRAGPFVLSALVLLAITACDSPQNMLDPHGPAAARIADLWWVMFGLATAVSVAVTVVLLYAVHRSRQRQRGKEVREINGRALVWTGGVIIPVLILFSVLVYSYQVGTEVYPPVVVEGEYLAQLYPPIGTDAEHLTVEVIGHQFWWEVRYPEYGVTTANEIHIPVGRRVRFLVSAPDVIHSFWIPQLQGKIDMIPGRINTIWVRADEPGAFRGQCAEYCGMSHALMAFWVVALSEEDFVRWIERRTAPIPEPAEPEVQRGREVFFAAGCGECHATRGAPLPTRLGEVGPDLTDLATRRTLAAGTLPNNRGALGGWITDPQRIKPGNRMPPTPLSGEELQALLTYLESLR